ncbi:MAG: PulJ/GspJ family protein [Candidatus Acidiferrales bacterium]
MKIADQTLRIKCRRSALRPAQRGFTFIELLVAMGVFLVVGGAAFALVSRDMPVYQSQQNLGHLNLSLRNAATQFELDLANAGAGEIQDLNVPGFPIGVTISNSAPAAGQVCNDPATFSYGALCFDQLNIIAVNSAVPSFHPSAAVNTTTGSLLLKPDASGASTDKGYFHQGDQLLLLSQDGTQMTSVVLTANAIALGANVQISFNATNSDGTNSAAHDPLGISVHGISSGNDKLSSSFTTSDWILNLTGGAIQYSVDASDPTNPKLVRQQSGVTSVVAEQIVGFKVGATVMNGTQDSSAYDYNAADYNYNYTLVRSIGITLIGRTPPNNDANYGFRNKFDQGPYEIQGISIAVNPRNLTMND